MILISKVLTSKAILNLNISKHVLRYIFFWVQGWGLPSSKSILSWLQIATVLSSAYILWCSRSNLVLYSVCLSLGCITLVSQSWTANACSVNKWRDRDTVLSLSAQVMVSLINTRQLRQVSSPYYKWGQPYSVILLWQATKWPSIWLSDKPKWK